MHRHRHSPHPDPSLHRDHTPFQRRVRGLVLAGVVLAVVSAFVVASDARAAGPAASAAGSTSTTVDASADARYRKDRAACDKGASSNQDRTACLKEAGAAKVEATRGTLADGASPQTREVNAIARCNALPQKDRADCMARIDGPGNANQRVSTSGSVAGGGLIRETVTTTTGRTASAVR